MFAITWRRAHAQNVEDVLAAFEFALENTQLIFDTAKSRHDLQFYILAHRRIAHAHPRARGGWAQPLWAILRILADEGQMRRFAQALELAHTGVIPRYAEPVRGGQTFTRIGSAYGFGD